MEMRTFPLRLPRRDESSPERILEIAAPASFVIPRQLMQKGLAGYERETLACFLACLDVAPPGEVLDIGANVGVFTYLAAAVGGRRTVAFEPMPAVADCAAAILRRNTIDATIERLALADTVGEATFYIAQNTDTSSSLRKGFRKARETISVELDTVDAYCRARELRPAVLKIDTESTEDSVLRGAREVLERQRPWIICEVLAGRTETQLMEVMEPRGYHWFQITHEARFVERREIFGDRADRYRNWLFAPEPPGAAFWDRMTTWNEALSRCGAVPTPVPIGTKRRRWYARWRRAIGTILDRRDGGRADVDRGKRTG